MALLQLTLLGHRAELTKKWHKDRQRITLLPDWPGNSLDMNPIENVWSEMQHPLRAKIPTCKEGIQKVCLRVWRGITPAYLKKLYESMPRRMKAVIDVGGGHTKY